MNLLIKSLFIVGVFIFGSFGTYKTINSYDQEIPDKQISHSLLKVDERNDSERESPEQLNSKESGESADLRLDNNTNQDSSHKVGLDSSPKLGTTSTNPQSEVAGTGEKSVEENIKNQKQTLKDRNEKEGLSPISGEQAI